MLPGLHGLPALAMMDPDAFADMEIGIHGMPMVLGPGMHMYMFNSPEMKGQMDQAQKALKSLKVRPFDEKQMEDMDKQMKDFDKGSKDKEWKAPAAPAAPGALPTPQAAPAPATPQPPQ